jgi:hypothetical protein
MAKNVRPCYVVVVNYTLGKARVEQVPFKEKFGQGWEVLYERLTKGEAMELMRAMAPVLQPDLPVQEAATMMA